LPGVVVEITEHNKNKFYKIGVKGGVLSVSYLRKDLVHELLLPPSHFGLENILADNWRNMPVIAVRTAVQKISPTGGQGVIKCVHLFYLVFF